MTLMLLWSSTLLLLLSQFVPFVPQVAMADIAAMELQAAVSKISTAAAALSSSSAPPTKRAKLENLKAKSSSTVNDEDVTMAEQTRASMGPGDLFLLNLLYVAPDRDSALFRLATVLARIEDLSHVLVWTTGQNDTKQSLCSISVIELPRLKIKFQPQVDDDGVVRLYLRDQAGWFVSPCSELYASSEASSESAETKAKEAALSTSPLHALLASLPHALLLENRNGELQLFVPNHDVFHPKVQLCNHSHMQYFPF